MASRSRSFYEPLEVSGAVRRIARAMVRRAADGDVEVLVALREMAAAIDEAYVLAGRELHDGPWGYSWADIAQEVGISRQAAMKRFGVNRRSSENPATSSHLAS